MQMAVSFLEHPLYKKFLELKCDRRVVTHFWPPGVLEDGAWKKVFPGRRRDVGDVGDGGCN